jgi:hypothetical protein
LGKFVILVGVIFLLLFNSSWLLPVVVVLAVLYLVYRAIWSVVTGGHERHLDRVSRAGRSGEARPAARNRPRGYRPISQRRRQEMLRKYLSCRSPMDLFGELIGSMLMSAFVAAVLGLVMMVVGGQSMQGPIYVWGPFYAWLVVVATAGSWAVLIPGKLWEGRDDATEGSTRGPRGEQVLRRFTMLVLGLAVAWLAFGLAGLLMVDLSVGEATMRPLFGDDWSASMFALDGSPMLPAYLAYFAGIYVVLRWWRQADPLRQTRLSLWTTAVAAGWAWLLHLVWPFPQPWGFMLAMTISLAVQLSTPWFSLPKRTEIQRAMEEA